MHIEIKQEKEFRYIDQGSGENMLLLHGLFGALSNWEGVLAHYSQKYRVIIPMLPIYDMPVRTAGVKTLTDYVEKFVKTMNLQEMDILGNSLGGHLALLYALRAPEKVRRLVLTGSSGLFENSMGASYPKRGTYEFIKTKVEYTFYNPETATKDLVDEVFNVTRNIPKCLNIVAIAKSAQRHNLATDLGRILTPTLLVWGLNDTITPPQVAHEFKRLMPNARLRFIDHCCHAPMMEHPARFNALVDEFIANT